MIARPFTAQEERVARMCLAQPARHLAGPSWTTFAKAIATIDALREELARLQSHTASRVGP